MTPEEKAREIVRAHKGAVAWLDPENDRGHLATFNSHELKTAIATALREAEATGRRLALEDAAKVADKFNATYHGPEIATAIRSLQGEKTVATGQTGVEIGG